MNPRDSHLDEYTRSFSGRTSLNSSTRTGQEDQEPDPTDEPGPSPIETEQPSPFMYLNE